MAAKNPQASWALAQCALSHKTVLLLVVWVVFFFCMFTGMAQLPLQFATDSLAFAKYSNTFYDGEITKSSTEKKQPKKGGGRGRYFWHTKFAKDVLRGW